MIEEILPLAPIHFFRVSLKLHHFDGQKGDRLPSSYHLPNLFSHFYEETPFAGLALGWSEKGIFCTVRLTISFDHPEFPHYREGDSIELFFDTRDVKTSPITRFCHHFCILPEPVETKGESVQVVELTRFRGEDTHPLAEDALLVVESEKKGRETIVRIFLPKETLHGYDPLQFDRIGFTYRINRAKGFPQYFSASGDEIAVELHPSHWASLSLARNG